jgi:soluble lytic murein transglycosylase
MATWTAAAIVALALGATAVWAQEPQGAAMASAERALYRQALAAAEEGRWRKARALAQQGDHALATKIVDWLYYRQRGTPASFAEVAAFVDANPEWPWRGTLRRNAERSLPGTNFDDAEVLAWMERWPVLSPEGRAVLGGILRRAGRNDEGTGVLRRLWLEDDLPRRQEQALWRSHRALFSSEDNVRRLDRLLWTGELGAARRMLLRVNGAHRAVAEARIALRQSAGNVDTLIARVPETQAGNAGLAFERVRWRRRKGMDERAREILVKPPDDLVRPDLWWREGRIQVRRAIADGHITDAYRIASRHDLEDGGDFAEAEWLAGWVALRFLREPATGLAHFMRMRAVVGFPVSIARAAYWAGRAAAAMGEPDEATAWYREAARHWSTYYGQLAMQTLGEAAQLTLPPPPAVAIEDAEALQADEVAQAARLLVELGFPRLADPFVLHLEGRAETASQRELVAVLSLSLERTDLSVRVGKRAARAGIHLVPRTYPLVDLPQIDGVETALVLAIARQETLFRADAVSPAGALGIMQLMPATARIVARSIDLRFNRGKLLSDPAYNATLGGSHLANLIANYDGSYVLAVAAYNAGEGRVNRWMRANGDPRDDDVDVIDWVETIPFEETRNYVQRVLESLQVYRRVGPRSDEALRLAEDLAR